MDTSMPLDIICDLFYEIFSCFIKKKSGQAELSYHRSYIKKKTTFNVLNKSAF